MTIQEDFDLKAELKKNAKLPRISQEKMAFYKG